MTSVDPTLPPLDGGRDAGGFSRPPTAMRHDAMRDIINNFSNIGLNHDKGPTRDQQETTALHLLALAKKAACFEA